MSYYAILRFEKHKGAGGGLEKHNERQKEKYESNPQIRTELSHRNYHLREPCGRYHQVIKERIAEAGCTVRSNSVKMVEAIMTASPLLFDHFYDEERERQFFASAYRFIEEKTGEKNIISAVVHKDERSPHMHVTFVPITRDDRLSAKDILGGPPGLRKWQDDFFKEMSKEIPGLQRGKEAAFTGRNHLNTATIKKLSELGIQDRVIFNDELRTLRSYVKSIPENLKADIAKHRKEAKKQRSRDERSR